MINYYYGDLEMWSQWTVCNEVYIPPNNNYRLVCKSHSQSIYKDPSHISSTDQLLLFPVTCPFVVCIGKNSREPCMHKELVIAKISIVGHLSPGLFDKCSYWCWLLFMLGMNVHVSTIYIASIHAICCVCGPWNFYNSMYANFRYNLLWLACWSYARVFS